jgi:hypothetical protein
MPKYYFDVDDFSELYADWNFNHDHLDCDEYIRELGYQSDDFKLCWYMTDESEFVLFRLRYGT